MALVTLNHAVKSSGWLDTINAEADAINNALSFATWSNAGLTWVNGFSDQDNGFFKYQTLTINGQKFLMMSGQIRFTQTYKAWATTQVVKFPDGVGINNAHMLSGGLGFARNGTNLLSYSVESDGLYLMPFTNDLVYDQNACWLPSISIIATI